MYVLYFWQANETGSNSKMELEGAKRCFSFIKKSGIAIRKFVSNRHTRIAKWIRETQHDTSHIVDVWHVARSVTKKMLKAVKVKNCECIKDWVKAVRNHLYWCATSTKEGFGEMIHAKWMSFLRHVRNVHHTHLKCLQNVHMRSQSSPENR